MATGARRSLVRAVKREPGCRVLERRQFEAVHVMALVARPTLELALVWVGLSVTVRAGGGRDREGWSTARGDVAVLARDHGVRADEREVRLRVVPCQVESGGQPLSLAVTLSTVRSAWVVIEHSGVSIDVTG